MRGFARGSLLYADGKGILLDEDGDLALLTLTPEGAEVLARDEAVRDDGVDGSDARGHDAVRPRPGERRGDRSGGGVMAAGARSDGMSRRCRRQCGGSVVASPAPGSSSREGARSTPSRPGPGSSRQGAPGRIHVTHPPVGCRDRRERAQPQLGPPLRARAERTTTGVFLGEAGTVTVTHRSREGETLVATGRRRVSVVGAHRASRELHHGGRWSHRWRVELVVGGRKSVLRYRRLVDVGPCESWASPV